MIMMEPFPDSVSESPLEQYSNLRFLLEEEIRSLLAGVESDPLRPALDHATSGGKRIRPMLTMIACAAVGGRAEQAVQAAVAVELLHASSLIHDDIMDKAAVRRSKSTVYRIFGSELAILAGDILVALAYRSLAKTDPRTLDQVLPCFTDGFVWTCEGQAADVSNVSDGGDQEHRLMVEKKTARLIETAAALGGLAGNAKQVQLKALRGFGLNIGMAYQAQDDLLDAVGSVEQTGKSVGLDGRNGRDSFASRSPEKIERFVEQYTERAYDNLDMLPDSPHRNSLRHLAESLVGRSK